MNMSFQNGVSRRNFLRGLGVSLALPAFGSVLSSRSALADGVKALGTTASGAPLRSAFIFFPNGAIPAEWWPQTEGTAFEARSTLQPLERSRGLIQVLGGLDHANAIGGTDGAGDHARGNGVFLTGVRLKKSATDLRAGTSIDQLIAHQVGHLTRLPSIELTCDNVRKAGGCDANYSCAYQYNISWASPTRPMPPESNPRLIFERLFGTGKSGERSENLRRRQMQQRSILDFVMDDARAMQKRLGSGDRDKLEQYLTSVREIETRIERAERFGAVHQPATETPSGVPSDQAEYVQMMYDMLVLAFQTDSTRVATFVLGHDGDNRSFSHIGIPEGHHDLSHHQNKPDRVEKVAKIDRWYVEQFARFLQKLRESKDVDGQSILHNSMIVYGSGNADGNRHTHANLPVVLAGGGGGTLAPGRYVNHGSTPMSNLFLSMADRMGVRDLDRFGDSTGRLTNV